MIANTTLPQHPFAAAIGGCQDYAARAGDHDA
jgi:hypothetical protein